MKNFETRTVKINKNVIKKIIIDPSSPLEENVNNQKKLKIRNKINELTHDGLDIYDMLADLSNAFFSLIENNKNLKTNTNEINKFKRRYSEINEVIKNSKK